MAIAFVAAATQVDVAGSSSTAPAITLNGTTGGNALCAVAAIFDANTTWTLTSTSDGGNTWTTRQCFTNDGPGTSRVRGAASYAVNITGGNRTIAFNLSGTSAGANRSYCLGCTEWSGVATSTPEDTNDSNDSIDSSGAVDASAGPITTTDAGDLIFGTACPTTNDAALNFASPTSWTNRYRQNNDSANQGMDSGTWLPAATQTTYTAQWSHDNGANYRSSGVVVALKPASGAAAVSRMFFPMGMDGLGGGRVGGNRIH